MVEKRVVEKRLRFCSACDVAVAAPGRARPTRIRASSMKPRHQGAASPWGFVGLSGGFARRLSAQHWAKNRPNNRANASRARFISSWFL